MPDAKDFAPNNPVYQKESPEPKYDSIGFGGQLQDDREDWFHYAFDGDYYQFDGAIRFVKATLTTASLYSGIPDIPQDELQNILRIDIREELNTDYSIIFESKIELK